jgi:hypothetical protein
LRQEKQFDFFNEEKKVMMHLKFSLSPLFSILKNLKIFSKKDLLSVLNKVNYESK